MRRTARMLVVLAAAAATLAGCAQPGQLGDPAEETAAPAPTAQPAGDEPAPRLPQLLGSGLVERPLQIRTPGPAVYSVRTASIPPGIVIGWALHPGTETTIVTAGSVTVQLEGACEPVTYEAGDALFIPDAVPHTLRNDGDTTAELVVAYLLAPGAPDQLSAPAACPAA